jgi:hypothetical protein
MPTAFHFDRPVGDNILEARIRVPYTDWTAAATTETLDLCTLPTGAEIILAIVDLQTTYADAGSISDLTIEVGTAGDPDAYTTSTDVFGATAGRYRADGVMPSGSAVAVKCKGTAIGGNLGDGASTTNLDSGSFDVILLYRVV